MSSELFAAQTKLQESRDGIESRVVSGINTAKAMHTVPSPALSDKRQEDATYEGSFAALYRDELERSLDYPETMPHKPEDLAMRLARMRIGDAPPPRADKRFLLEAFWVTIEILLILGRMAQRCSDLLTDHTNDTRLWHDFAYFIFEQAHTDSEKALAMAHDSESHRKVVSCSLLLLRADVALARFRLKDKIAAQDMTVELKAGLLNEHARTAELFKKRIEKVKRDYEHRFGTSSQSDTAKWLRENFGAHTGQLLKSWEEVKGSIRLGTWYTAVTDEEKISVVKAFNFAVTFIVVPTGALTSSLSAGVLCSSLAAQSVMHLLAVVATGSDLIIRKTGSLHLLRAVRVATPTLGDKGALQ
ncbi:hypothetical protein FRC07_013286 [Ceratobasidium sp. 392]|nr:hypothetical protein FRC07_013286 [Ceratobasidium sp. 392]